MKLYVASSWRNADQPRVVAYLESLGHAVYDFRHPQPGNEGFHWSDIDPNWQEWTAQAYRDALNHSLAASGFAFDFSAMQWADGCVLVLPSGRSAHLEAGYFVGAGKPLHIFIPRGSVVEPELMYRMARSIAIGYDELAEALSQTQAALSRP